MAQDFDKADLTRLRQQDSAAIEHWFSTYCDGLYSFVYYRVGKDAGLAADIVQETFVGAVKRIEQYDHLRGSMFAWLTYLSKNHIKKALRQSNREVSYDRLWQDIDARLLVCLTRIATEPLPDEVLERKETAELVQVTLANIPANYKQVLKYYYYQQKALNQIAELLGISDGAAKALLYRARKAFKEAFLRLGTSFSGPEVVKGGSDA